MHDCITSKRTAATVVGNNFQKVHVHVSIRMEITTHIEIQPKTVEKNSSTISRPKRIEPKRLCDAGAML